jgi:hypothetical protein
VAADSAVVAADSAEVGLVAADFVANACSVRIAKGDEM